MKFCDNATESPNTPHNYNFNWNGAVIPLNTFVNYPCKNGHSLEQSVDWKHLAAAVTQVKCNTTGLLEYPNSWPQCSTTINCPDPGNSEEITRTQTDADTRAELSYASTFRYVCEDPRKWIKLSTQPLNQLAAFKQSKCLWRKTFQVDGNDLVCVIHHCQHPHDDPGKHDPPPVENQITLVARSSWTVQFGQSIKYRCAANTFIEDDGDEPSQSEISVQCLQDEGIYNTPVKQGGLWPNCTETVVCGQPPEPAVNVTRTWLSPAVDNQETYDTYVRYQCQDGSQFDTDGDGVGDSVTVTIRCLWNKAWHPYPEIPPCIVTHCVEPFNIPDDTNLEELTSAWTPINTNKEYKCKNQIDNVPTMFWETDRTKSTFSILCNPDGYFIWPDWPICLTDIECSPIPPVIPTDPEYTLTSDDGKVVIRSIVYPTHPTVNRRDWTKRSTFNNTEIPRNYMANLTYHCGSAREFLLSGGSHTLTESMTCQWDRTWTPKSEIHECDWVACLKPPIPPKSTFLRVTDWFGDPIPFGEQVRYVCERGYYFEEDPSQVDVKYTCQDGSAEEYKDKRGFFDVPEEEGDWPRCLLAPLCPKPPNAPEEGKKEHWPLPIPIEPTKVCYLDSEVVSLTCNSFLNVYVTNVTYGRDSVTAREVCDGDRPDDLKSLGTGTCYDQTFNDQLKYQMGLNCHGTFNCTYQIPTVPLTTDCDGLRRETRIDYICVECFNWASYIVAVDCKQQSLLNNKWVSDDELAAMEDADILDTLIKKLSKYYDKNVHSEIDLRMREETSDKGSLCGMAAVYQAGLQTLFSISELKQMSYNDVKIKIGEQVGLDAVNAKKAVDVSLLSSFYEG